MNIERLWLWLYRKIKQITTRGRAVLQRNDRPRLVRCHFHLQTAGCATIVQFRVQKTEVIQGFYRCTVTLIRRSCQHDPADISLLENERELLLAKALTYTEVQAWRYCLVDFFRELKRNNASPGERVAVLGAVRYTHRPCLLRIQPERAGAIRTEER